MTAFVEALGLAMMLAGTAFLVVAAIGVWRLPDLLSRLHVLTKADTAGVALIAIGAAIHVQDVAATLSLALCTLLVAVSGATTGHLIARDQFNPSVADAEEGA
ncbi:multisubunit sodium/proton antiporter MrpG subunit [Aliiruegeria haliotis]|uniref:Multisubunit sodium/proton antiporter MrpG subunit n=1 Tax=Aliiruegeria haliotis TaxID=1280846 RepID=A0A2T0RLV4_9RHOB|nr:monovalent cation/H(+) antiporter subunit G [Aliiruegeria haliotis]PRY22102.1 multisubunit sodium/proton antiporter MrpG subunit [Aliiruegeria haliotis]